jgi:hypothetical protein
LSIPSSEALLQCPYLLGFTAYPVILAQMGRTGVPDPQRGRVCMRCEYCERPQRLSLEAYLREPGIDGVQEDLHPTPVRGGMLQEIRQRAE